MTKRAMRARIAELEAENVRLRLRRTSIKPEVTITCDPDVIYKGLLDLRRRRGGQGLGLA
jgi:hypothetical protein